MRWLEKVFQRTVGDHGEISLNDFKTIVQSKNVSIRSDKYILERYKHYSVIVNMTPQLMFANC